MTFTITKMSTICKYQPTTNVATSATHELIKKDDYRMRLQQGHSIDVVKWPDYFNLS